MCRRHGLLAHCRDAVFLFTLDERTGLPLIKHASASAEGGVEASPVDGTPDSERLLSDGTHWGVALTAVALLATSAVSYGLPA